MDLAEKHRLFERAYPELFAFVYRFVCYRIPSRPDAEDVVSDVFVAAIATLDAFDPERGTFSQWITGIARNKIRMHWRQHKPTLTLDTIEELPEATEGAGVQDVVEEHLLIERVMKEVPAEGKVLLAMRYIDDMTHEDIAGVIEKSPAAVRQWFSRLHRALRIRFTETET